MHPVLSLPKDLVRPRGQPHRRHHVCPRGPDSSNSTTPCPASSDSDASIRSRDISPSNARTSAPTLKLGVTQTRAKILPASSSNRMDLPLTGISTASSFGSCRTESALGKRRSGSPTKSSEGGKGTLAALHGKLNPTRGSESALQSFKKPRSKPADVQALPTSDCKALINALCPSIPPKRGQSAWISLDLAN